MKAKEKRGNFKLTLKNIICCITFIFILFYLILFYNLYFGENKAFATEVVATPENEKISQAEQVDLDKMIEQNTKQEQIEEIVQEEIELEYLTEYRTNTQIAKGISYVIQEGRQGKQLITKKRTFENGEMKAEEQIAAKVTKAAFNKIVEIGGANRTATIKVKVGDEVMVTSDELPVKAEPNETSEKLATLAKGQTLKVVTIATNWYEITSGYTKGWVKQECTTKPEEKTTPQPNKENQTTGTAQNVNTNISFTMDLRKPSGLSLEQFKKVLTDKKDTNNIFVNNAEYFYYIEKQYQINGLFVAAVGIHESGWGTSKIALDKKNLFGYGAYDSNPYQGAYQFTEYAESIDLIARVFVKYYLNPKGTSIYGGETAAGTYYNSPTLTGVNQKYATDKNWAKGVYTHMQYLYGKIS